MENIKKGQEEEKIASTGTQSESIPTTSSGEEKNVESTSQTMQNETVYVPSDKEENVTAKVASPSFVENDYKALSGKVAQLEKQNAEYAKQAAESSTLKEAFGLYEEELKSSPEAFNKFAVRWKTKTGKDIGTYDQYYGNQNQQISNGQPIDVSRIAQIARQEAQSQVYKDFENRSAIDKFLKVYPEMDFNNELDTEAKKKKSEQFARIAEVAALNEKYFKDKYNMDLGDTLIHFYKALPENITRMQEQAQQSGQIIGRQDALARGVGISFGASGGVSSSIQNTVQVPLTADQRQRYEYWQGRDPKFAARLLKRYAGE